MRGARARKLGVENVLFFEFAKLLGIAFGVRLPSSAATTKSDPDFLVPRSR